MEVRENEKSAFSNIVKRVKQVIIKAHEQLTVSDSSNRAEISCKAIISRAIT